MEQFEKSASLKANRIPSSVIAFEVRLDSGRQQKPSVSRVGGIRIFGPRPGARIRIPPTRMWAGSEREIRCK